MATLTYTPTTRLEAVNLMLSVIDEAPIHTLEVSGLADADVAQQILHEKLRSLQTRRWNFNYEQEYVLSPDVDGYISLPANVLAVDVSDCEGAVDVTSRGGRLYDRKNHTFVFTKSLKCDILFFLEFEDLPEAARYYAAVSAAHAFQGRIQGSLTAYRFTMEDVQAAWLALSEAEGEEDDANILSGSYSVANVLLRNP
jgi:hypothetical protein